MQSFSPVSIQLVLGSFANVVETAMHDLMNLADVVIVSRAQKTKSLGNAAGFVQERC